MPEKSYTFTEKELRQRAEVALAIMLMSVLKRAMRKRSDEESFEKDSDRQREELLEDVMGVFTS